MNNTVAYQLPTPILNKKEFDSLESLTNRYTQLTKPHALQKVGEKANQLIPEKAKELYDGITSDLTEQELYKLAMEIVVKGFRVVEEQAARFSISEDAIVAKIAKKNKENNITQLSEICLTRSYVVAQTINSYKTKDLILGFIEGGATGFVGLAGLPFNIVLSTFLYFRAVQSIAMHYGYDTKNDSTELMIASEVFSNALSPARGGNEGDLGGQIGKIMLLAQGEAVKQAAKKSWAEMANRGGVPLLIAQMRALANKSAQKALEKAGAKGLENSVFREVFEQIGRKLTLKATQRAIPVVSFALGALIDTAQMNKVLEYADIFYQKRYILEKDTRISSLVNNADFAMPSEVIESDIP